MNEVSQLASAMLAPDYKHTLRHLDRQKPCDAEPGGQVVFDADFGDGLANQR